jgi:OOP family OmpA-OmpF porin
MKAGILAVAFGVFAIATPVFAQQSIDPVEPWQRAGCPPRCGGPTIEDELLKPGGAGGTGGGRGIGRSPPAGLSATAEAPSGLYIQFATGSAELTPQAMAMLDLVGEVLGSRKLADSRFRIEGHTDTVGTKEYNQRLSERRAASVAAYIERKFGVSRSRLVAVGLGSEHPLVTTPDQTPEARNRRVQVINAGT